MKTEFVKEDLTAENLFRKLQKLVQKAEQLTLNSEERFNKYSPFDYVASNWKRELAEVRQKLIPQRVEQLRKKHMPWIRLERVPISVDGSRACFGSEGFEKLMDKAVGRENFRDSVIQRWFRHYENVPNWIEMESRRQILERARSFVPWKNAEPSKDVADIWDGKCTLKLHAYFMSYDIDHEQKFEALEKVMCMAIRDESAAVDGPVGPISRHVNATRDTEEKKAALFTKQLVDKATPLGERFNVFLESFTCYKNGHFYVRFRNATFARQVAELLMHKEATA